ncbi:hypothetical protein CsSME_00034271 [Camellia sinensis var. sinensis]
MEFNSANWVSKPKNSTKHLVAKQGECNGLGKFKNSQVCLYFGMVTANMYHVVIIVMVLFCWCMLRSSRG